MLLPQDGVTDGSLNNVYAGLLEERFSLPKNSLWDQVKAELTKTEIVKKPELESVKSETLDTKKPKVKPKSTSTTRSNPLTRTVNQ